MVQLWLENYREVISERITNDVIIESIEFISQRQNFRFDTTVYHEKFWSGSGAGAATTTAVLIIGN